MVFFFFFLEIMLEHDNHWNVYEQISQNEEKNIFVALKLVRTINDDAHFIRDNQDESHCFVHIVYEKERAKSQGIYFHLIKIL